MGISRRSRKAMLLAGGAVTALALAPMTSALAQDDEPEGDVIVITGIKKSIQDSLEAKKNSSSVVEAISAEDIGKLPDVSIADALARLPGLAAQRVGGRAQQISVRGLGPDFSISTLNGREQVSASDNRGIEFDQYPSELISQALVYKTPDATLASNGIAGTIDLKTIRPLSYSGRTITGKAQYVQNSESSYNPDYGNDGYRLFGSVIDQNDAGTVGWVIGATTQLNPVNFLSRELKTNNGQVSEVTEGALYPSDNPRTGAVSREFTRDSISGTLEWQPSEWASLTVDAFYSKSEDSGIFRGLETPIASWSGATLDNYVIGSNPNFVESANYGNVNPVFRTDFESREAELFAGGINLSQRWTENFKTSFDVSLSKIDRTDRDFESYAGFGNAGSGPRDSLGFFFDRDGEYTLNPMLDYSNPSVVLLTDPGGWGQAGFDKTPQIHDEIDQYRAEAEYTVDNKFFSDVIFGALYTERAKDRAQPEAFIDFAPGAAVGNELQLSGDLLLGTANLTDLGIGGMVAYDPLALLSSGVYTNARTNNDDKVRTREWLVEENVTKFYAMANIDSAWNNIPVRGNVGFQYEEVDQSSTGGVVDTGSNGEGIVTSKYSYENFLPSLNLAAEIMEDTFLRFAYARTVTRPRMDELRASRSITRNAIVCPESGGVVTFNAAAFDPSTGATCFSINGGNTSLDPIKSDSFDLSFEKYFDGATAIILTLFYKDLDDYILTGAATQTDLSAEINALLGPGLISASPDAAVGFVTQPINATSGSLSGVEFTVQSSFDRWLPPELAGFGGRFSYTSNESDVTFGTQTIRIPGLSKELWSGDVYYENNGWRGKLAARYRGDYQLELIDFSGSLVTGIGQEETVVDAQFGYQFQDGPMEGVSILFDAYNITDEPFVSLGNATNSAGGTVNFPSRYELNGKTFNLTVSKTW